MPRPKTLIIGLDGATFDVIDPLVRDGVLPTIGRLRASGMSAPLTSVYPPVTGPAWASLATGKSPGKTGVFDFLNRREVGGRFQSITVGGLGSPVNERLVWPPGLLAELHRRTGGSWTSSVPSTPRRRSFPPWSPGARGPAPSTGAPARRRS